MTITISVKRIMYKCNSWNFLYSITSFQPVLYEVINSYVPVTKVSYRKYPPWFNSSLMKTIKLKHNYFRKFKATDDITAYYEFVKLKKPSETEKDANYKSYCRTIPGNFKSDSKSFRQFINNKNIYFSVFSQYYVLPQ